MAAAASSLQGEFRSALLRGSASDVQACIDRGAAVDEFDDPLEMGMTPLHLAVETGQLKTVQVLLAANAPLESKMQGGDTPLHCAVQFRDDLPSSSQPGMLTWLFFS